MKMNSGAREQKEEPKNVMNDSNESHKKASPTRNNGYISYKGVRPTSPVNLDRTIHPSEKIKKSHIPQIPAGQT
jgi:hypothetical protein